MSNAIETMTDEEKADALFLIAEKRAWEQFDAENWDAAERDYSLLTRLRPNESRYWAMLGAAAVQGGSPARGANCLKQAVKLDPDYDEAWLHLGEAMCLLGRLDEGVEILRRLYLEGRDPKLAAEEQSVVVKRAGANLAAMITAKRVAEEQNKAA